MINPKVGDELLLEEKGLKGNCELLIVRVEKVGTKFFTVAWISKFRFARQAKFARRCNEGAAAVSPGNANISVWSSDAAREESFARYVAHKQLRDLFRPYQCDEISPKATTEDLLQAYNLITGANR